MSENQNKLSKFLIYQSELLMLDCILAQHENKWEYIYENKPCTFTWKKQV